MNQIDSESVTGVFISNKCEFYFMVIEKQNNILHMFFLNEFV